MGTPRRQSQKIWRFAKFIIIPDMLKVVQPGAVYAAPPQLVRAAPPLSFPAPPVGYPLPVAGGLFPGPNNGYLPPHPLQQQLLQQQQQQLQQQQLQQQQLQQQQQQLQGFPYQQQQLGFPPGHYHPSVTGMKTIQVWSIPFIPYKP